MEDQQQFDFGLKRARLADVLPLRDSVLHWTQHPLDKKKEIQHIIAVDKWTGQVIAVVSYGLVPTPEEYEPTDVVWRGYGFAVLPSHRKSGVGERLLQYVLREAQAHNATWVFGIARLSMVSYYVNRGAESYGEEFKDYVNQLPSMRIRFKVAGVENY